MRNTVAWVVAACFLSTAHAAAQDFSPDVDRDSISLNGTWRSQSGEATADRWESVTVPGPLLPGLDSHAHPKVKMVRARREFSLDARHATRSAVLKWGGIRFGATVIVNGKRVARHTPMGPHTVLLPAAERILQHLLRP